MKKIFSQLLVFALFFIVCCTPSKVANINTMEYACDTIVGIEYIDSVCIADTLGIYPKEWIYTPMRSYDNNKNISTYGWLKASNWTFYRIIPQDSINFRFTKRVIK